MMRPSIKPAVAVLSSALMPACQVLTYGGSVA